MAVMEAVLLQSTSATTLLGTFVILFVLYLLCSSSGSERKEPPGPRPLPLLGNLLQLDFKSPHRTLNELYKKYGPVITVHIGPKKVVMVSGLKAIKQALVNNDAFEDKETPQIITDLKLSHGINFLNRDSWKEMRHFVLTHLRKCGMGKRENEEMIIKESQYLIEVLRQKEGKAFDTTHPVSYAAANILCSFIYGNRFEYDDPNFRSMVDDTRQNIRMLSFPSIQLYNKFPRLFRWIGARKQVMKTSFENRRKMMELIRSLEETLNPQMCRGFVDYFLVHKTRLKASQNTNSPIFEDHLLTSVVHLFSAGIDSLTVTIRYGLLLMAKYPEIQDQVQEELARAVGNRQVRVGDRTRLPYTDAVVHEIQRFANITPIIEHCASRDVTFQGYFIKKGTPVVFLLSSLLHDEDEWEKAHTFNPGHFLDKEGNFVKRDAFLPFSAGSRSCIGESLARMEIFLFITSLLQLFRFTPPPGVTEDELDVTPVWGFPLHPPPHELCATSRVRH